MDDMKKEIAEDKNKSKKEDEKKITSEDLNDTDVVAYYLEKHPDIKGCFGTNITATQLGLKTLKQEDKIKDVILMGFDAGKEQLDALKSGDIKGLVVQNPFGIGYASVIAASRSILESGNEAEVNTGYIWVTGDNLEEESIQNMLYQ
jgi:ribose transport system substrate-binding protein